MKPGLVADRRTAASQRRGNRLDRHPRLRELAQPPDVVQ
jgi:hypothetical protein